MEFKPKEFLDKWVEENYPEENISEEEFDNADMIMFAHEYHQAKLKLLGIADASSRFYQVDFGNHLRCKLKITDGKIEVEGAINGWGDGVPLEQVVILELNAT